MVKRLIAAMCAFAVFLGAVAAQRQANDARAADQGEEILFLPNQKLLNHFTGGMNNIVADLLWLRCIQYIATESKGDRNFTWLNQMLNTVVQLDPYFGDAYRYGGMFLAALKSDDDAGIALLEQGVIANPRNFQLPYELLRELAQRKLVEIEVRGITEKLNEAVIAFNQKTGRFPNSLEELAGARIIPVPMNDPLGGRFLLGEDGVIRNTTLLDETKKSRLKVLDNLIKSYKNKEGSPPPSLDALVEKGLIQDLPTSPYPGEAWNYDPLSGIVE